MDQIVRYGKVRRGQLGIAVQDLTSDLVEAFGAELARGAVVAEIIPGSSAVKAGPERGDITVAVNGVPVSSASYLRNRIGLF